jgi:hypothetical protein
MVDMFFAFMQVKFLFLWLNDLVQMLMNVLVEMHEEWLPIPPLTAAAAARAPAEEMEVAVELRRLMIRLKRIHNF